MERFLNNESITNKMKEKPYYEGIWISIFLALIAIGVMFRVIHASVLVSIFAFIGGVVFAIVSVVKIHNNPKHLKGMGIAVTCLVICSLGFLISLVLAPVLFFMGEFTIDSELEAKEFAMGFLNTTGEPEITELTEEEIAYYLREYINENASIENIRGYAADWESGCSVKFTHHMWILEDYNCE